MTDEDYFNGRMEGRTYVSRVIEPSGPVGEPVRMVTVVMDGAEQATLGELHGPLTLRVTGQKRRTQYVALASQDTNKVKRLTLETYVHQPNGNAATKASFALSMEQFDRIVSFLESIDYIDFSDRGSFRIDDRSSGGGRRTMVDQNDARLLDEVKRLSPEKRTALFEGLQGTLTKEETTLLLGRRAGLAEFAQQVDAGLWKEAQWHHFFKNAEWVFGYGLDYRIMGLFDTEMAVGGGGLANKNKPTVDYLMTFKDYTVLVEIKTPSTRLFKQTRGTHSRAGTWELSPELTGAVSQILHQKAEWTATAAASRETLNHAGDKSLEARTRDAKSILVIGNSKEFGSSGNLRDTQLKRDTFELFRRNLRNIDVVTFDELFERARYIVEGQPGRENSRTPRQSNR